jgi:hypothetical protein
LEHSITLVSTCFPQIGQSHTVYVAAHNTLRISNRGAKSNSNDNATADSHNPEEDGTEHRTDNTDDGHSREEDQSNFTPPAT